MLKRGTYKSFVDDEAWVVNKFKNRDAITKRTFRKPVLEFSSDVMEDVRSRGNRVSGVSRQVQSQVTSRLSELVE